MVFRPRVNPDEISDKQGRTHEAFEIVRRAFRALFDFAAKVTKVTDDTVPVPGGGGGSGGGGGGPASDLATRTPLEWVANGPYRDDTDVDGPRPVHVGCKVVSVRLARTNPGTSGSTILDLNRNGSSLYLTQANRPTILYTETAVDCSLPDLVNLVAGDVLTVDTDQKESGHPDGWTLAIEVA